jgi:hypothetical protein
LSDTPYLRPTATWLLAVDLAEQLLVRGPLEAALVAAVVS